MRRTLIAVVLAGLAGASPSSANDCYSYPPLVQDDRIDDLTIDGVPVVVLKPVGYEVSDRRYPVIFLLHGFGQVHGPEGWLNDSDVISFTETQPEDERAIVVSPGGDWLSWRIDWRNGAYTPNRFFIDTLIPELDARYRTIPDRRSRAIAGPSGGAYGALLLASRHPDLLGAVGGLSPAGDPPGVLDAGVVGVDAAGAVEEFACRGGIDPAPICGYSELCWRNSNPADLAINLRTLSTYVANGNGVPCDAEDVQTLTQTERPSWIGAYNTEPVVKVSTDKMHERFTRAQVGHVRIDRACGIHSFRYWNMDLRDVWSQWLAAMEHANPTTFDHRAADPSFSVWDWTFTADAARAPEFLDVRGASCDGFGLRGSGTTTVTTAPCFTPGASVLVNDVARTADAEGRLTLSVDLGPAHQFEQFTPAARALESVDEDYWTIRTITFDGGTP